MKIDRVKEPKKKRDYKFTQERTEFERALKEWLIEAKKTNYVLYVIAMLLAGIFLRLVFGVTS